MADTKYCRNCAAPIGKEAAVCVKCGFSQNISPKFCRECGAAVPEGAAVCLKCGTAQKGGSAPSAPGTSAQMDLSNIFGTGPRNPTMALLLSVVPGLGQAYNGELVPKGVAFFLGVVVCMVASGIAGFFGVIVFFPLVCLCLTIPAGFVIWVYAAYDAYMTAQKTSTV